MSEWTLNTLEQGFIAQQLLKLGVVLVLNKSVQSVSNDTVQLKCIYSDAVTDVQADTVVMVTAREPERGLWDLLQSMQPQWADNGVQSIKVIGDADAPAPIAWATYAGHRFAREFDAPPLNDALSFKREVTQIFSA